MNRVKYSSPTRNIGQTVTGVISVMVNRVRQN